MKAFSPKIVIARRRRQRSNLNRIAVFLDRDGVINRYPGDTKYVTNWREFRFLPNAKKAIALLTSKDYPVFVISNQAGVSKGIYSQNILNDITKRMLKALEKSRAKVTNVLYCIHRDEDNCSCRKPKDGLIKLAVKDKKIDLKNSFFIGDTIRDIYTAKSAGCKSILVFSGKEKPSNRDNWQACPDFTFKDLYAAAQFIITASSQGVKPGTSLRGAKRRSKPEGIPRSARNRLRNPYSSRNNKQ